MKGAGDTWGTVRIRTVVGYGVTEARSARGPPPSKQDAQGTYRPLSDAPDIARGMDAEPTNQGRTIMDDMFKAAES